jgi:glycine oxidase
VETPEILIVGGGIIGCALARELARANQKVLVVERGQVGAGASSAAAGLLAPALSASPVGPLADLCFQSAALYDGWVDELRQDGAGDVGYRCPGLLELYDESTPLSLAPEAVGSDRQRIERLSPKEVRKREPALRSETLAGLFYPDAAQVNPTRLTRQVARVGQLAGVEFRLGEAVQQLLRDGDRISAVHTGRGVYHPGTVVLTAGAWSGEIASTLALELPTRPVKGQLLLADCLVSPVRTPMHYGEALLAPQPGGRLMLGVTVEEAGFDVRVTVAGVRAILERTAALVPGLDELPLYRAWAGLRPATPDEWPYMGPVLPLKNLWVSTGHYRKGILLAPLCARLMARSILADRLEDELAPFKPTRRSGSDRRDDLCSGPSSAPA